VWPKLLREHADPDAILVVRFDDGSETHVATGVRIAQVLHHGTDHRSQIATALTTLGIEPPGISAGRGIVPTGFEPVSHLESVLGADLATCSDVRICFLTYGFMLQPFPSFLVLMSPVVGGTNAGRSRAAI
jgi:hypothetical protein